MLKQLIVPFVAVGMAAAFSARAQTATLDWTFTETDGTTIDGSGTLVVDTSSSDYLANSGYLIESFSGTYLGQTVNGLGPLYGVGLGGADDLLMNLTGNPDNTDAADQIDYSGITFSYGDGQYDKFRQVPYRFNSDIPFPDFEPNKGNFGTFSAVPEPAPEPATLALAGLGGLGLLRRFRQRK